MSFLDRKRWYFNLNHKVERSVLLAGSGRSGTTWLAQVLNHGNYYRYMFEPFHPAYTPECAGFNIRQYIRPDAGGNRFFPPARAVLSGRVANPWVDAQNGKLFCDRRLVKDIRVNLLLKWLRNQFPSLPILFLMRHPCAVANSRIVLEWSSPLPAMLAQADLVEDHIAEHVEAISHCRSAFEKEIYLWCIEHYVPLRQCGRDDFYFLFYEHLCTNPLEETEKLFGWLGRKVPEDIEATIRAPSATSAKHSAVLRGRDLVAGWTKQVGPRQAKDAVAILHRFGLDRIYGEDPWPLAKTPWG